MAGQFGLPSLLLAWETGGKEGVKGGKSHLQNERKNIKNFVIFSEIMLDKCIQGWYTVLARVGGICGFFRKHKSAMR